MIWELVQDRRSRRPVVTNLFSWSPPIVIIMREKDIPRRAGMLKLSAEKEQQLTAMLATRILKKGVTRLGKKEKARFATKVGICVDNVQYRWMCYKRSYLTKVRQFCLLMTCFVNIFSPGPECTNSASSSRESCTQHFLEKQTFLRDKDEEERERGFLPQV